MNNKLIIVDGIFGSGKSTITKIVSDYLHEKNIENIFYEEESLDNPLYLNYCEEVKGREETLCFMQKTLQIWMDFVSTSNESNSVYIVESTFFMNSIRILFHNLISEKEIDSYFSDVIDIIKNTNPLLIYLHKKDVPAAIQKIWNIRGDNFKKYCLEVDASTLYSQNNNLCGDDSTILLWQEYQKLTEKLYIQCNFNKIKISTDNDDWHNFHHEIFNFITNNM
jgi:hypothetical protein